MSEEASVCDESIFTQLFKEYAKTLHNFMYYKTGDQSKAQDYTQEAFTRLWKNCSQVSLSSAKGYVFKIANNLLINDFNHNKVVLQHQAHVDRKQYGENPEFILEGKEFKERLESAIADLPEKQRVVFLLSRIDKKTYKEIGEALGISKQAVEKRMYNALDSLRKISKKIK